MDAMDEDEVWAVYEALHASVHMVATDQDSTMLVMDMQEETLALLEDITSHASGRADHATPSR